MSRDDYGRGNSKGFAHIEFTSVEEAHYAIDTASGTVFEGRKLGLESAVREKPN
jgi:RNA recognition motif-containing protein